MQCPKRLKLIVYETHLQCAVYLGVCQYIFQQDLMIQTSTKHHDLAGLITLR